MPEIDIFVFLGEPDRPRFLWRRTENHDPGDGRYRTTERFPGMLDSSSSAREPDGGMPSSKTVSQRMVPRLFALLEDRYSIRPQQLSFVFARPTNIDSVPRVFLISIDSPLGSPRATSRPARTEVFALGSPSAENPIGWRCPWGRRGVRRGICGRRSRPPRPHRPTTTGISSPGGYPRQAGRNGCRSECRPWRPYRTSPAGHA